MESDVEILCRAIYDNGEQYMDGTGAIAFSKLKQVRIFFKKEKNTEWKKILNNFFAGISRLGKSHKCNYYSKKISNYRS